jgi:hypothetical protein
MVFGMVTVAFAAENPSVRLTFDVHTSSLGVNCDTYDPVIAPQAGSLPDISQIARCLFEADNGLVAAPALVRGIGCMGLMPLTGLPAGC